MTSDFRVLNLESKLTIKATTWDVKIQIPKLELRGVNSVKDYIVREMSHHMHYKAHSVAV
mgnify:CR=1 FL=1